MSAERRDQMLAAVEHAEGYDRLRAVVKRLLDQGTPTAVLLEDLNQIRVLVPPDVEDDVLDVMDLLTGWCAPQFRLAPPEAPGLMRRAARRLLALPGVVSALLLVFLRPIARLGRHRGRRARGR